MVLPIVYTMDTSAIKNLRKMGAFRQIFRRWRRHYKWSYFFANIRAITMSWASSLVHDLARTLATIYNWSINLKYIHWPNYDQLRNIYQLLKSYTSIVATRYVVRHAVEAYIHSSLRIALLILQDSYLLVHLMSITIVWLKQATVYYGSFMYLLLLCYWRQVIVYLPLLTTWIHTPLIAQALREMHSVLGRIYQPGLIWMNRMTRHLTDHLASLGHGIWLYIPVLLTGIQAQFLLFPSYIIVTGRATALLFLRVLASIISAIGPSTHYIMEWTRWFIDLLLLLLSHSVSTVRWWIQQ